MTAWMSACSVTWVVRGQQSREGGSRVRASTSCVTHWLDFAQAQSRHATLEPGLWPTCLSLCSKVQNRKENGGEREELGYVSAWSYRRCSGERKVLAGVDSSRLTVATSFGHDSLEGLKHIEFPRPILNWSTVSIQAWKVFDFIVDLLTYVCPALHWHSLFKINKPVNSKTDYYRIMKLVPTNRWYVKGWAL